MMSSLLEEATSELQSALYQAISSVTITTTSSSNTTSSRYTAGLSSSSSSTFSGGTNNFNFSTLERKRALRRIYRALLSIEELLLLLQQGEAQDEQPQGGSNLYHHHSSDENRFHLGQEHNFYQQQQHDNNNMILLDDDAHRCGDDNNKRKLVLCEEEEDLGMSSRSIMLPDSSIEVIILVIHELSKFRTTSTTVTTTTTPFIGNDIQDIYTDILNISSKILQNYASLPLSTQQIDSILDPIAVLATQKAPIPIELVKLINHNLLALDDIKPALVGVSTKQQQGVDGATTTSQQQQQQHDYNSAYFLLDAAETSTIIQLLLPIVLDYLSHPWDFRNNTTSSSSNSENNKTSRYYEQQAQNIHEQQKEHDDANQDIRTTTTNHRYQQDDDINNQMIEEEQHFQIQLRILLGYLLKHLSLFLQQGNSFESILMTIFGTNSTTSLFHTTHHNHPMRTQQQQRNNNNHHYHRVIQTQVEDYMDLVTSFWMENIRYTMDIMNRATTFLNLLVTTTNTAPTNKNSSISTTHYSKHKRCNNYNKGSSSTSTDIKCIQQLKSDDDSIIRMYIHDSICHTSLAVGMIELYSQDLNIEIDSSMSKIILNLYKCYTTFVASFCNDTILFRQTSRTAMGSSINHDMISEISTLNASADNTLFRLCRVISAMCNHLRDHEDRVDIMVPHRKHPSQEENGSGDADQRWMANASIITFLRAYQRIRSQDPSNDSTSTSNNEEEDIIEAVMNRLKVTKSRKVHDTSWDMKDDSCRLSSSSHSQTKDRRVVMDTNNILQACIYTNLVLPHTNRKKKYERDLAILIRPLLCQSFEHENTKEAGEKGHSTENTNNSQSTNSVLVDSFNPWNHLIARKLSETMPHLTRCKRKMKVKNKRKRDIEKSDGTVNEEPNRIHQNKKHTDSSRSRVSKVSDNVIGNEEKKVLINFIRAVTPKVLEK